MSFQFTVLNIMGLVLLNPFSDPPKAIIGFDVPTICFRVVPSASKSYKKGKRIVQGVPQSQTAALPRPQEEEETDKSKQAQTEQTYEKH